MQAAAVSRCCLTTRKFQVWLLNSDLFVHLIWLCTNNPLIWVSLTSCHPPFKMESRLSFLKIIIRHRTVRFKVSVSFLLAFWKRVQAADLPGAQQLPWISCSLESVPRGEKRENEPSQMHRIPHAALNNCHGVKNSKAVQPYTLYTSFERTIIAFHFLSRMFIKSRNGTREER